MKPVAYETAVARPFVPAKDFEVSKRFYLQIGFQLLLDAGEVAIFRIGRSSFLLQNHYNKEWAENFMMQLMVDDCHGPISSDTSIRAFSPRDEDEHDRQEAPPRTPEHGTCVQAASSEDDPRARPERSAGLQGLGLDR